MYYYFYYYYYFNTNIYNCFVYRTKIVVMTEYLVTCVDPNEPYDEIKKILKLYNKRGYKNRILSLFNLPEYGQYRIQAFNERFKEWVEVDSYQDLPDDGGRLKIIASWSMLFCYGAMH